MYHRNTPFEGEEWYLMGLMEKPVLLHFPQKIERLLFFALLATTGIGLIIALFVSVSFYPSC